MSCYQWALDTPFLLLLTTAMTAAYRKKNADLPYRKAGYALS